MNVHRKKASPAQTIFTPHGPEVGNLQRSKEQSDNCFHEHSMSYTLLSPIWLVAMLPIKVYYIRMTYGNLYGKLDAFVKETRLGSCVFQTWKVPDTDTGLLAFREKGRTALSWAPSMLPRRELGVCCKGTKRVLQGNRPRFTKPVWLAHFVLGCFQVTLLLDKKKPVSNVF